MSSIYQLASDACPSKESSHDFPFPQAVPTIDDLVDSNFDLDIEDWEQWMRWEAPIDDVRPLMDRQNSDTTQSDSSLETQCESPLGQTTINDTLSELFSTIPDLDLVTRSPDTASQQNLLLRYRGYSSLTIAQVQALEKIAMPNGIKAWEQPSPSQSTVASPSETEAPKTKKSIQKRKHSRDKEPGFASGDVSLGQSKREGHNTIEKRYRANLNDKIYLLGQSIPNLTAAQKGEIEIDDQENGANPLPDKEKYSKAVIIMRAVQYITYLETQNKKVGQQAFSLNTRVEAFEKLAKSGSFDKDSASGVEASDTETLESIRNDFQESSLSKDDDGSNADQRKAKRRYSKNKSG